jgi:hypothetical protein
MAEVPDHLVPEDGLTNSFVRFHEMKVLHDGERGSLFRFGICTEKGVGLADFEVFVEIPPNGGVSQMIADAHRHMGDVLRQWLYVIDKRRQSYET